LTAFRLPLVVTRSAGGVTLGLVRPASATTALTVQYSSNGGAKLARTGAVHRTQAEPGPPRDGSCRADLAGPLGRAGGRVDTGAPTRLHALGQLQS